METWTGHQIPAACWAKTSNHILPYIVAKKRKIFCLVSNITSKEMQEKTQKVVLKIWSLKLEDLHSVKNKKM